jgi:hypothetical protein
MSGGKSDLIYYSTTKKIQIKRVTTTAKRKGKENKRCATRRKTSSEKKNGPKVALLG